MTSMTRVLGATGVAAALVVSLSGQSQDGKPQQPPVFRSGAHYVRVDAYPARDGRPILGLTSTDFELLEDGKPQTIEARRVHRPPGVDAARRAARSELAG